jgi:ribosomal protein S18 acetylase RimI-like enzyme
MDEIKPANPACPWHFMACAVTPTLQLNPAEPADEPWQRQLFANLRGLQVAMLAACPPLLDQQWRLQKRAFAHDYPDAQTRIIRSAQRPIGTITLHHGTSAWRLLEIGLEPDCRGQGIGERLLRGLTTFADEQGQTLELAVMRHNPALRLYQRLGFVAVTETPPEAQLQMRRVPTNPAAAHAASPVRDKAPQPSD